MSKWSGKFSTTLKETGLGPGRVYNENQKGLFYTKLPNRLCVPIINLTLKIINLPTIIYPYIL